MQNFAIFSFWAICVLTVLGLGVILSKHGQPKTGKSNFWLALPLNVWIIWTLWYFFTH